MLGFKHSPDNIAKFKLRVLSPEHKEILSLSHTGKVVSQETRDKLAVATATYRNNHQISAQGLANLKASTIEREGVACKVLNSQTNEVREFTNQTAAGEYLGVTRQAIYNAIKRDSKIKGVYTIKKV